MCFFKFIILTFLSYFLFIYNVNASVYDFRCKSKYIFSKNKNIVQSVLKQKMFFKIDPIKDRGFLGIYSSSVKINKPDGKIFLLFDVSDNDDQIFRIEVTFTPSVFSKDNITKTSPLMVSLDLHKLRSKELFTLENWLDKKFEKIGDATYECDNWNVRKFKEYFAKDYFNKNDTIY